MTWDHIMSAILFCGPLEHGPLCEMKGYSHYDLENYPLSHNVVTHVTVFQSALGNSLSLNADPYSIPEGWPIIWLLETYFRR